MDFGSLEHAKSNPSKLEIPEILDSCVLLNEETFAQCACKNSVAIQNTILAQVAKASENGVAVQNTILAQVAEMQKEEEASGKSPPAELDSIIPQEFSAVDAMLNDNRWFFNVVIADIQLTALCDLGAMCSCEYGTKLTENFKNDLKPTSSGMIDASGVFTSIAGLFTVNFVVDEQVEAIELRAMNSSL